MASATQRCGKCGGYLTDEGLETALENAVAAGATDWPGCGMAMDCRKCACKWTLADIRAKMEKVKRLCDGLPFELRRELEADVARLDKFFGDLVEEPDGTIRKRN